MGKERLFFQLLKVAIGRQEVFDDNPSLNQWEELFSSAKKQALIGVCFSAIEKLPAEQRPPKELLMQWWAITQQIEKQNTLLNHRTIQVWESFARDGFRAIILKGQGNARWYPNPLRRQSGDIDVWLTNSRKPFDLDVSRAEILSYVKSRFPVERADLKHIHYPLFTDVAVEVHFQPGIIRGWRRNRKLQDFFTEEMSNCQGVKLEDNKGSYHVVTIPSPNMNAVYLLVHLFDHFMYEGVGMRQVLDYYYFLLHDFDNINKEYICKTLKNIHLLHFCGAVMWILKDVFCLNDLYLIAKPDKARGTLLLNEIIAGGNFGQYDDRLWKAEDSRLNFYWRRTKRQLRFFRYYPVEVISTPLFLAYQRLWIKGHN